MKKILVIFGLGIVFTFTLLRVPVSHAQNNTCTPNSTAVASGTQTFCQCNSGYKVNSAGTACVIDYSQPQLAYGPFNFENLLIFTIVLGILYFIIRFWGDALNKTFEEDLDNFIKDKSEKLTVQKEILLRYGALLVLLLPFLLAVFIYAAFVTVMFGIVGVYLGDTVSFLAYWAALGLVLILTAYALVIGFYRLLVPPKLKPLGIWITPDENPKLWGLTKEVAAKLSTRPVDKILIAPMPGIGVRLEGPTIKTLRGGGDKILAIGIPSTYRLSVGEFTAILAHEYGHFSNRDTQWGAFTFMMGVSLESALRSMPGPRRAVGQYNLTTLMMSANPAYYIVLAFTRLYFKITKGFSRIREVMADVTAMTLYGGSMFEHGLMKVAANDNIFNKEVQGKHVVELLKQSKTIPNFTKFMEKLYDDATVQIAGQKLIEESATAGVYGSHPALSTRIGYARKLPKVENLSGNESFGTLFDNWDKLNEDVAKIYNQRFDKVLATIAARVKAKSDADADKKEETKI